MPTYLSANYYGIQPLTMATTSATETLVTWVTWNTQYTTGCTSQMQNFYYCDESPSLGLAPPRGMERRLADQGVVAEARQADERAEALLKSFLDPAQLRQYETDGHFDVTSVSNARYRLTRGWAGNILRLGKGDVYISRLCIHHEQRIPIADLLLAQKMMIETDERQFLAVANATPPQQNGLPLAA